MDTSTTYTATVGSHGINMTRTRVSGRGVVTNDIGFQHYALPTPASGKGVTFDAIAEALRVHGYEIVGAWRSARVDGKTLYVADANKI